MSKRALYHVGIAFLVVSFLIAMIAPAVYKTQQGAHVVRQHAAFKEVCRHIEDYNKLPEQIPNLEIDYDPNAFGHANKPIFYRKYFLHEVVTYGNGHYKLINREGEVVSEGAVFGSEEQKNTFRKYTGSEPYKHKR